MAKDIIFAAGFVASGVGATGLTVTVDVWRVAVADLAKSEIVTAGSATEIGDGVYAYRVASADLQTYYYYAIFKTAGTADVKHLFGAQLDFSGNTGDTYAIVNSGTYGNSALNTKLGTPAGASVSADIDALPTANENADALLDRTSGIETSFTLRQALRLILAMAAGKVSISGATVTIRDVNDSKNRIVATTDADGQRTDVTKDVS